jgi:hypothetical protein
MVTTRPATAIGGRSAGSINGALITSPSADAPAAFPVFAEMLGRTLRAPATGARLSSGIGQCARSTVGFGDGTAKKDFGRTYWVPTVTKSISRSTAPSSAVSRWV